jgi:Bacterial SH3 domain
MIELAHNRKFVEETPMNKFKSLCLFALFFCSISFISAQDTEWRSNKDASMEFNCNTLTDVIAAIPKGDNQSFADIGNMIIARSKDGEELSTSSYISMTVMSLLSNDDKASITVDDIFAEVTKICDEDAVAVANTATSVDEFNVIVNGNVNIRSCAGTQCEIVQVAESGSLLTVIAVDGDWYEVRLDTGTAFIASSLTTRGPDEVISVDDTHFDAPTGCYIAFDQKRGDMAVNIIIYGKKRNDVLVDLYRPADTKPLRVDAQYDKTFTDTNDPYIDQYYAWSVSWPLQGRYQLEVVLDGTTRKFAWEFKEKGDYAIFVGCD